MIKWLVTFFCLAAFSTVIAQTTNTPALNSVPNSGGLPMPMSCPNTVPIPDSIFRAYLEYEVCPACFCGGELDTLCAATFNTGPLMISCYNKNIGDLTGINYFKLLSVLYCEQNHLTNLNLTNLPNLVMVNANENILANTNFKNLPSLNELSISDNLPNYFDVDLSQITALKKFSCSVTGLKKLKLPPSIEILDAAFTFIDAIDLSNLTQINKLYLSWSNLSSVDITPLVNARTINLDFGQYTEPDSAHLKTLQLPASSKLWEFSCQDQQLSQLDLSVVPKLRSLNIYSNHFSTIDLSPLDSLQSLWIGDNDFTSIDISANDSLKFFSCYNNALEFDDLQALPFFPNGFEYFPQDSLGTPDNKQLITGQTIALSVNTPGSNLNYQWTANGINLVDGGNVSGANSPNLIILNAQTTDAGAYSCQVTSNGVFPNDLSQLTLNSYSVNIGITPMACPNTVPIPDPNFRAYLENTLCPVCFCSGELDTLCAATFNAPTLTIDCKNKGIADLTGVNYFKSLVYLKCDSNAIAQLHLSDLPSLSELSASHNPITDFQATNLPVLDILNLKSNPAPYYQTLDLSGLTGLTNLDCSSSNYYKLKVPAGIKYVDANNNFLDTIDLTGLSQLIYLNLSLNNLTNLDASDLTAAQFMFLGYPHFSQADSAHLSNLILPSTSSLTYLSCTGQNLTQLDLSGVPNLTSLFVGLNNLKDLNVSANPLLEELYCDGNALEFDDLQPYPFFPNGFAYISQDSIDAPSVQEAYLGQNLNLTVNTGGTNLVYQWTKNGADLANVGSISGVNTPNLSIANTQAADAGAYSCKVTTNGVYNNDLSDLTLYRHSVNLSVSPCAYTVLLTPSGVSCFGASDGSILTTTNGGSGNFNYQWDNGVTTANQSGLAAGDYTLTITDNVSLCSQTAQVTITQPTSALSVTADGTQINCPNGSDGTAFATISGGTPPYSFLWSNNSTADTLKNLPIGVYSVTITDLNGCAQTAQVTLIEDPTPDCVWPGDADTNHLVEMADVYVIGYAAGATGPVRPNATTNWQAQYCPDWANATLTNVNFKHADTDGDGDVDTLDFDAVKLNYGLTSPKTDETAAAIDTLYLKADTDTLFSNTLYHFDVIYGTPSKPITGVYTLLFGFDYTGIPVQPGSVKVRTDGSWFGARGQEQFHIFRDEPTNFIVKTGLTRINHLPAGGSGKVGTIDILTDNISGKDEWKIMPVTVELESAKGFKLDGTPFEIAVAPKTFYLVDSTTARQNFDWRNSVRLYPNPNKGQFRISGLNFPATMRVTDLTGRAILENALTEEGLIDLKNPPDGIYLVEITTKEGRMTKKITVVD